MINKIQLWWGLWGKVGLSGNILVKKNIPKSKFDNGFDIRKESIYTKYEENPFAGFFNMIVGKIFGNF